MRPTLGRYRLVTKLATGGMGEVWLADETRRGVVTRRVVVKTLRAHLKEEQDFVNMFFDEARIASVLHHPGIAEIYDLGEDDGEYFIVMEYVHGYSLRDVVVRSIEADLPLDVLITCRVVAEAALALDFAHQAVTPSGQPLDLIHRDVSPHNILVGFNGDVKLIDFGVAKAANKIVSTGAGIIKGKYAYMSPEQAYGRPLDGRSDVFGLGVVLWEVLTRERLFRRENDTETLKAVVGAELVPPSHHAPEVPRALDAIVMKALERDVTRRYQSAREVARALDSFVTRQRPVGRTHLSAYMRQLFPVVPELAPVASRDVDMSTAASIKELEIVSTPSGPTIGLDARDLEARIAATTPADLTLGLFFNAVSTALIRRIGPAAASQAKKASTGPRSHVDALGYSTGDYLRVMGKGVELLTPVAGTTDGAFDVIGTFTAQALLHSSLGKPLEAHRDRPLPELFRPLVQVLSPMVSPGVRTVTGLTDTTATVLLKEEVLPVQLYVGLIRSLVLTLHRVKIRAEWERPVAERVELTLWW